MAETSTLAPVQPKLGRPSEYTEAIGERVCEAITNGLPIRRFRDRDDLPDPMTLYRWAEAFPTFRERFAQARRALAEHYAFEGLDILDSTDPDSEFGSSRVSKARDQAGHRRWLAGCLDPATYRDSPQLSVNVATTAVIAFTDATGAAASRDAAHDDGDAAKPGKQPSAYDLDRASVRVK